MSSTVFEKHAHLYGNVKPSEKEQEQLDKLAAAVRAAGSDEEVTEIWKKVLERVHPLLGYKMASLISYYAQYEEEEEKRAGFWDTAHNVAGAMLAVPVLGALARQIGTKVKQVGVLERVYKDHPELRNDPNVPRYFKLIKAYAPQVAANDLMLGNTLEIFRQMGPAAVTPASLRDILTFEMEGRKTRSETLGTMGELGKVLMLSQKSRRGGLKDKDLDDKSVLSV